MQKPYEARRLSRYQELPVFPTRISLWELLMIYFKAADFVAIQTAVSAIIQGMAHVPQERTVTMEFRQNIATVVAKTGEDAEVLNLDFTLAAIHRFRDTLLDVRRELMTMHEISDGLDDINSRLLDEMNKRTFFYVPQDRAAYFDKPDRYGSVVASKCPQVTEDVSEAGNCFSAGRYTATVFHLMRIMEHGVQRFGTVIGAPITDTKNWQAILNEVNARIKGMDPHDQKTKFYAEISAHLYHVKLAWRNEVMHPKATYTEEEAKNLIKQVGEFMETLAIVL